MLTAARPLRKRRSPGDPVAISRLVGLAVARAAGERRTDREGRRYLAYQPTQRGLAGGIVQGGAAVAQRVEGRTLAVEGVVDVLDQAALVWT